MSDVMELILVLVPLAMTIIVALALVLAYRLHQWNSTYRELAKRYRGQFYSRLLLPQMAFRYGQNHCRLENFYRRFFWRRPVTRVLMNWPDRQAVLEITSHRFGSRLWGGFRYSMAKWNEPILDDQMATRLGPGDEGRDWINSDSAQRLLQLLNRLQPREFNLLIRNGTASVTCGPFLSRRQQLEDLLQLTWQLLDQLKLGRTQGLDFLSSDPAAAASPTIQQGLCPVCNQQLTDTVAICIGCRTPHCQDCWEYNGGCATFACGEKRFQTVREASHT